MHLTRALSDFFTQQIPACAPHELNRSQLLLQVLYLSAASHQPAYVCALQVGVSAAANDFTQAQEGEAISHLLGRKLHQEL